MVTLIGNFILPHAYLTTCQEGKRWGLKKVDGNYSRTTMVLAALSVCEHSNMTASSFITHLLKPDNSQEINFIAGRNKKTKKNNRGRLTFRHGLEGSLLPVKPSSLGCFHFVSGPTAVRRVIPITNCQQLPSSYCYPSP